MLRQFLINFAILSMALDAFWMAFGLKFATAFRPLLSRISFIQPVPDVVELTSSLYIVFPLLWVSILSAYTLYDGRKHLRVVDEFTTLTMASFIASISMAGILYLSYRQVSRAIFLLFVLIVYASFLGWRTIARFIFRLRKDWPDATRRMTNNGLEWVSRLVIEPRRLCKRYLIGNPLFFWRVFVHHILRFPLPN